MSKRMTYMQQWQKMSEDVKASEEIKQMMSVHTPPPHKYGFYLNINHPLINVKWEAFKQKRNIGKHGMTDELRREFEKIVMKSKYYQKCLEQEKKRFGAGVEILTPKII